MNKKELTKKKNNKPIKSKPTKKIISQKKDLNLENLISLSRLKCFLIISFFIFFALVLRLFYLQLLNGSYLSSLAIKQQISSEKISSKRGTIFDSTGVSLAISETVDTISINPSKITAKTDIETQKIKEKVASGLAKIFDLDYDEVLSKVNSTNSSETIIKKVEETKVNELKKWMKEENIKVGINIDDDTKRFYPYYSLASQVIGVCGKDNQGLTGIEFAYDSILKGTAGEKVTSADASRSEIPNSQETFIEAENGYDLSLSIDFNIQTIAEKYLKQAVEENSCSKGGNCIIMEPSTGNILAMASVPDYDLNSPFTPTSFYSNNWDNLSSEEKNSRIYKMWSVRSISETYEPGSVFKLITAAVALDENITKTDIANDFSCNGFEDINGTIIKCWKYQSPYFTTHGTETLREALMNSCNPAFMQLAKKIGSQTLYKYYNAFGFFNKTNVGLSGESAGVFYPLNDIHSVELATMSFGQRFTITPLQMCTALCAISNNGYLVQPKLVKSVKNTDTGEVTEFPTTTVRQVISAQTANSVKSMMQSVVTDGTGKNAQVQGYSIGGKSGTSEPVSGDINAGYTTSFAAISPIENTQVVILVTLYDPNGDSHQGGQTAAPVVSKILSEVLPYLGIEPDLN